MIHGDPCMSCLPVLLAPAPRVFPMTALGLSATDLMVLTILDQSLTKADLARILEKTDDQTLHYLDEQSQASARSILAESENNIGHARETVRLLIVRERGSRHSRRAVEKAIRRKQIEPGAVLLVLGREGDPDDL